MAIFQDLEAGQLLKNLRTSVTAKCSLVYILITNFDTLIIIYS